MMSGIVAAHGPFDPALGDRMLSRLAHRGPHGVGSTQVGDAWLGSRYLSITDPRHGGQPIASGSAHMVGDGEIYNHNRIRARLADVHYDSDSDFEAALALFDAIGPAAFDQLWGTYALVMAADDGRFAVGRDVLGIAPLYWARRGDTTLFASEMKAFDADWRPLVAPFPPGHVWTPDDGLVDSGAEPAEVPVLLQSRAPEEEPPAWVFDAVRETLVRAVERRLDAEPEVGVLLSGGVDSSIVTAIAARRARENGTRLKTFAVGMEGSADLAAARAMSEFAGTDHYEEIYTADDAIALVPDVIASLESFDPTLVHSAVPNHLVSQLASRHVSIVLVGEGADELFAGYSHYGRYESGVALHEELLATIAGMHIGGLQRVDRVAAANGMETRLPFLDLDVVELALALPPGWKLTTPEREAKWLLRRAFDGWVPGEVLWRPKEQFGQGTGMNDVLRRHFGATVSDDELARDARELEPPIRTREELAYYRLFTESLPGVNAQTTVGRFVEA
ncbi:asparagine synthase-related protein [Spelaeicoccus albus]|nr:asparagine synthase-related protein [Spelaeicoccus albus]